MKYILFNCAVIAALLFLLKAPDTPPAPPTAVLPPLPEQVSAPEITKALPTVTPPPLPAPTPIASHPAQTIPSRAAENTAPSVKKTQTAPKTTPEVATETIQETAKDRTQRLRQMMAEMEQLYVEKISQ